MFVFNSTDSAASETPATPWADVRVASVDPTGWPLATVVLGVRELERIRRETDAALALLVGAMPDDRDATGRLAREAGISNHEARRRRAVASVIAALPEAGTRLASGALSSEHLASMRAVCLLPGAAALLESAVGTAPEEFARRVEQFRLARQHGDDSAAKQRALRHLRFNVGPEGMIGLRGLLPPLEGARLRSILRSMVDARWTAQHPLRARQLGGHGGDSYEQRMADALLERTGVTPADRDGGDQAAASSASLASSSADSSTARTKASGRSAMPATIVVFDIDRYEAELLDHGPVPVTASLFEQAKAALYLYFKNGKGEILKFGRARRDPSIAQRLAVMARDRGCDFGDCDAPVSACSIHHFDEWLLDNGFTDVEVLGLFCDPHHRHIHLENLRAVRELDGSVTIIDRTTGAVVARASPKRKAA